jgi:anhydro-N-acetylmuramic acid kinase
MSGTSYDAIETAAAALSLEDKTLVLRPLGSRSLDYPDDLRAQISAVLPPARTSAEAVCRLDTLLGQTFADAAALTAEELCDGTADLVVSHGQTVFHWVEDGLALGTLQLGNPAWISEKTNAPVVSDLRSRDVAAGGQGAPLVSLFDTLLLAGDPDDHRTRAALNLGGIANLTIVPAGDPPLAFDTGPANALTDAAVAHLTNGTEAYDEGGRRAARGKVHEELLSSLLTEPYYGLAPPKSTGKELFNFPHLLGHLEPFGDVAEDDLMATVTALTARTVADALRRHDVAEVVASGGGTANPTLMGMLEDAAPETKVRSIEEWGIPSGSKEAYAFGVLGFLSLHGLAGTVPSCTGAGRATVLGSITQGRRPLVLPAPAKTAPRRLRIEATRI